jgi:N-acetylglutamate synthase-like GNAT family acetyltransferase
MALEIQPISKQDLDTVQAIIARVWKDAIIVVHNDVYHTADLEGIKVVIEDRILGILHYQVKGRECEILTLVSLKENQGIGTALLTSVESIAKTQGCEKLSLITTNDNLHALGFYQRRGFHLTALFPNQVAFSRKIKPGIPRIGENRIPLRDEIKLEKNIS